MKIQGELTKSLHEVNMSHQVCLCVGGSGRLPHPRLSLALALVCLTRVSKLVLFHRKFLVTFLTSLIAVLPFNLKLLCPSPVPLCPQDFRGHGATRSAKDNGEIEERQPEIRAENWSRLQVKHAVQTVPHRERRQSTSRPGTLIVDPVDPGCLSPPDLRLTRVI